MGQTGLFDPRFAHRVLVVAAHPDDEVLGCGGTIARHADLGHRVDIILAGEGITSRDRTRRRAVRRSELTRLAQDAKRAATILGAHVRLHDFPDNRFDTVPLINLVKMVEEAVQRTKPTVVYTHHEGDLNIDHQRLTRAVLTALRPLPDTEIPWLLSFEVASSTEYQSAASPAVFRPTIYVDISKSLDRKCQAMLAYRSEARDYPHPRSAEALVHQAHHAGSEVGRTAAERFALLRMVTCA